MCTVYSKRNTHLIPNFFLASMGEGGQKLNILDYVLIKGLFYSFSVETEQTLYSTLYLYHDMTLGQGQRPKGPWKNGKIQVVFLLGKSALPTEFLSRVFFIVHHVH